MKELIVTADDFGYSRAVNAAVVKAYQSGILRYASLMVKGDAALDAVALARENPGLGVGLHLDLCRSNPALWGLRYFLNPADRRRIEPEISSQIEKFLSFGLKPTHADGHFNIHVHPMIFPALAGACRQAHIPRLRLPGGEAGLSLGFDHALALPRLGSAGLFATLGGFLRRKAAGLEVCRTFGLLRSGMMKEDYLLWLVGRLPEGRTEIYFHPSSDPASVALDRPTPTHQTITELESLTSPRVRRALREANVRLAAEALAPKPVD